MNKDKIIIFTESHDEDHELIGAYFWKTDRSVEECYLDWLESSDEKEYERTIDFEQWLLNEDLAKKVEFEEVENVPWISPKNEERYKKIEERLEALNPTPPRIPEGDQICIVTKTWHAYEYEGNWGQCKDCSKIKGLAGDASSGSEDMDIVFSGDIDNIFKE